MPNQPTKKNASPKLILLRHGESMWNRSAQHPTKVWRYAGAMDIPLSQTGVLEAMEAGKRVSRLPVDYIFTSNLSRATMTAFLVMNCHEEQRTAIHFEKNGSVKAAREKLARFIKEKETAFAGPSTDTTGPSADITGPSTAIDLVGDGEDPRNAHFESKVIIPMVSSDLLNERHFGSLTGVPSTSHAGLYPKEELVSFRNSFAKPFPDGESSQDVYNRVIPYFEAQVLPLLKEGKNVLMVSHGFVMRSLIKYLENLDDLEWDREMAIEKSHPDQCRLAAHTGIPQVYALQEDMATFQEEEWEQDIDH